MPANSYTEWTEEDIHTLEVMYANEMPICQIAKALERTPRAIELAIKNLLLQEVLHRGTQKTSEKYNVDMDSMYTTLVPEKYFSSEEPESSTLSVGSCILITTLAVYVGVMVLGAFSQL